MQSQKDGVQKDGAMKRIAYFGSALAVGMALTLPATAQSSPAPQNQAQDQSSLGDYARKVHKDTDGAKAKPKVFDNDNLPKDDKLSIVGDAAPAAAKEEGSGDKTAAPADSKSENKGEAKDAAGNKPAASPEDDQAKKQVLYKQWQEKLSAQKDQIDLASRELDVLQREYQLRAAEMYADVGNRLRNSAQWDKQEADYKQKIVDKQKAVDDAKQKLDDMQEEARKAGVPAAMRE
jgi:hypothetical protein